MPPSREYCTSKYASVFAESELVSDIVEALDSEEQEPNDCEAPVSIIGQSTVELSVTAVYPPLKDPLLDEDLYDHTIVLPSSTDCVS